MKILYLFLMCFYVSAETNNPYQKVWDDEGSVSGIQRFFLDIDNDGVAELFVAAISLCGTGGCPFFVFKKKETNYIEIGELFLHPAAFALEKNKNGGINIIAYTHLSAFDGEITYWSLKDNRPTITKTKKIKSEEMSKYLVPLTIKTEETKSLGTWH